MVFNFGCQFKRFGRISDLKHRFSTLFTMCHQQATSSWGPLKKSLNNKFILLLLWNVLMIFPNIYLPLFAFSLGILAQEACWLKSPGQVNSPEV
jgi:hypothetical protein